MLVEITTRKTKPTLYLYPVLSMDAATNRRNDRKKVFYVIIAAALLYNLILLFASKETDPLDKSENERTTTTLYE